MDPALVARLEHVANRMENILLKHETANSVDTFSALTLDNSSTPQLVVLLDEAVNDKLAKFCDLSHAIGGDVAEIAKLMKKGFEIQREYVFNSCGRLPPKDSERSKVQAVVVESIVDISKFKDDHYPSTFYEHICAVDSAASGFGWVAIEDKPTPYVKGAIDMAMYYGNRILVAYKGNDKRHVEWVNALKELWMSVVDYVKTYHTIGLVWNTQPGAKFGGTSKAPTSAPPPPPPLPFPAVVEPAVNQAAGRRDELLESLNTGIDATRRLRKVTPEMQTHKNPSLRANPKVPKTFVSPDETGMAMETDAKVLEPRIFWDGKIWRVDYQDSTLEAVVEVTDKKESVYIYKCRASLIKIKGKANAVTLDHCSQVSLIFDGLVSQCEVINSHSIQIQTLGELPTVSIQKTDGCHVYLSRLAQNAQIVASKSSAMNVSAQLNENDDEYTEMAIPEQFVTVIKGKKLFTTESEIV